MHFHCQLIAETPNSSLSVLTLQGRFVCFILEDGYREKKEAGQTRIPPGVYRITPRKVGRIFETYRKKYGCKFVPELADVPGFKFIIIHAGLTVDHTDGCPLCGYGAGINSGKFHLTPGTSADAFLSVYEYIEDAFDGGEEVTIRISRELVYSEK
jgi:hypothetical protein